LGGAFAGAALFSGERMTQIRYIGPKPVKTDNVAGTGLIWNGYGTVHEVTDPVAAGRLLSYSTVWEDATDAEDAAGNSEGEPPKNAAQKVAELDALRERAKALGVDVKGTWGAARLTKAIEDAAGNA
jgi:hypothetical protein